MTLILKPLDQKLVTKVTSEDSQILEGYITLNEISNSLKAMKNNKCPGEKKVRNQESFSRTGDMFHYCQLYTR